MINHLRCLLLDLPRGDTPDEFDEYVPPDFAPRSMAAPCRRVWQLLFGTNPDRSCRNYLLHRYLRLVQLSGFEDALTYYDRRLTDGATQKIERPWTKYGKVELLPADGRAGVITIPQATNGKSYLDEPVVVTLQSVSSAGGTVPIVEQESLIYGTGIIIWVSPNLSAVYQLKARLRPPPTSDIPKGLTGDLAYITAEHPFADRFRKIVEQSPEWPLRQAAIVAGLACRLAHDRGDQPA